MKVTSAIETISTYTQAMEGKILVNINELPCASTGEFMKIMNQMKTLVTDSTFECRRMYSQGRTSNNTFGLILFSNNDAISISASNFKRYKMLDVSNKYIGDTEYFCKLDNHKNDAVGEAFYAFLDHRYHKRGKFINVDLFPHTDAFKDKICERLDTVYDMLKHCFIKKHKPVEHTLKSLYSIYKDYHEKCRTKKGLKAPCKSDKKFSSTLKDLKCMTHDRKSIQDPKTGKKTKPLVFSASWKALYQEFDKKGWIHELDDIEPEEEQKPPSIVVESTEESEMSEDEESEYEEDSSNVDESEDEVTQNLDADLKKAKKHTKVAMKNTIVFD